MFVVWRKNFAGKQCLFIGGDESCVAELKSCFGWTEMGRINSVAELSNLQLSGVPAGERTGQVLAVCAFNTPYQGSRTPHEVRRADVAALGDIAQAAIAAMAVPQGGTASRDEPLPTILYFVEEAVHTPQLLINAIQAGAVAYFACTLSPQTADAAMEMTLIYSQQGIALDHKLSVAAVLLAQGLSPFQLLVMGCLRDNIYSDKEIALAVKRSPRMVNKTITQLFAIFNCNRRSVLAKQSVFM